jgi:Ca2+-binding RTX toxin-like protein
MALFDKPKTVFDSPFDENNGGLGVSAFIALDANEDGFTDYLVARAVVPQTGTPIPVELILGQKNGAFKSGATLFAGGAPSVVGARPIQVADFDGDGHDDVLLLQWGRDDGVRFDGALNDLLLWRDGKLKLAPASYLPADKNLIHGGSTGDIDGDGDLDVFVADGYGDPGLGSHFLINDSTGTFTRDMTLLPESHRGALSEVKLADFDSDGDLDAWLGVWSFTSAILRNPGDGGQFEFASDVRTLTDTYARQVDAVDLNHDGLLDVLQVETDNEHRAIGIYINQGELQFENETKARLFGLKTHGEKPWQGINGIEFGDFNGDGAQDIIVMSNGDDFQVLLNTGDGVFFAPRDSLITTSEKGGFLKVDDINRDGKDDIVYVHQNTHDLRVQLGTGKADHPLTGSDGKESLFGNARGNKMDGKGGNDAIRSGAGKDNINGGAGKDTIDGGSGKDRLDGGLGKDKLTGGEAKDIFVFSSKIDAADIITDFAAGTDKIALERDIFSKVGKSLDPGELLAAAGAKAAQDKTDRIIYDTNTGKLYYDADGNQSGGAQAVHFATLSGAPLLEHGDFIIV